MTIVGSSIRWQIPRKGLGRFTGWLVKSRITRAFSLVCSLSAPIVPVAREWRVQKIFPISFLKSFFSILENFETLMILNELILNVHIIIFPNPGYLLENV